MIYTSTADEAEAIKMENIFMKKIILQLEKQLLLFNKNSTRIRIGNEKNQVDSILPADSSKMKIYKHIETIDRILYRQYTICDKIKAIPTAPTEDHLVGNEDKISYASSVQKQVFNPIRRPKPKTVIGAETKETQFMWIRKYGYT